MNAPLQEDARSPLEGDDRRPRDADESTAPDPRRGFWRRAGVLMGLLALALVVLPAILLFAYRQHFQARLDEELARLRAANEPTTPAELEAYYRLPPGTPDCTQLWLDALGPLERAVWPANIPIVGANSSPIPPPGEEWVVLPEVESFLQTHSVSLQKMHQAAELGGAARYPTRFNDGFGMLLTHVQTLRTGVRLLQLEAHARAHRGDVSGVAKSVRAMISLGNSLNREPVLISQLVGIACRALAIREYGDFLSQLEFSDQDLEIIAAELKRCPGMRGAETGVIGERVLFLTGIDNPGALAGENVPALPLRQEDKLFALTQFRGMLEGMRGSPQDALAAAATTNDTVRQNMGGVNRVRYMMTAMLLPAMESATTTAVRDAATVEVALAATAAARFRLAKGRYPEQLSELVPDFLEAVPLDPFDSQPLRLKPRAVGIVIYSMGQDQVDDGGVAQAGSPVKGDIVIELTRGPHSEP